MLSTNFTYLDKNAKDENLEKFRSVSVQKVVEAVHEFKSKKSTGLDCVPMFLIKEYYRIYKKNY